MEKATLSIVIPVYNKAPFLRRCLDSLVAQTDKDAQIIVIDDGSTDDSGKICDEYKQYGFEIYHTKNNGVSEARNLGIKKSKSEWITFLDADDKYTKDAIDIMKRTGAEDVNDIVQFGQYRHLNDGRVVERNWGMGAYGYTEVKRQWVGVWNKMYKASLIKDIRYIKGLQFGEDEMFNIECLLKNRTLYHSRCNIVHHYFDDLNSLCRAEGLPRQKLERLIKELRKKKETLESQEEKDWIDSIIKRHYASPTFTSRACIDHNGKYDVVYFLKEDKVNEELRYSLRSIEKNFQYRNVVFYGGCPEGLKPDKHFKRTQTEPSKWERVRASIRACCLNPEISDKFWLFNDDFFIMKPMSEEMPAQYNGDIRRHIEKVKARHGGQDMDWTIRLRHLCETLERAGKGTKNYAVHKPILIDKAKALEVLDKFPDEPMFRALYGNYWDIGGVSNHDMKVLLKDYPVDKFKDWEFLSTQDDSFRDGTVGKYIRRMFNEKSRYE